MHTNRPATLRKTDEGRTISVVGDIYRFLATGDETNGKYAIWEAIVPPGGGPPPHVHSREEEAFYILEGEITIQIGEQRIVATQGMFANMPVGTPHSFKNESSLPAKMLISVSPAGLEHMFFEIGAAVPQGATTVPLPTKAEIEKLLKIAPQYGIEIKLPHHDLRASGSKNLPNNRCVEGYALTANRFDCESRRDSPTGILAASNLTRTSS
ncbi:MAG: qdoI [Planctomycetaceae bacterium]|nr:qdoI [Planctomycetaceae bacterium]